MTGKRRGKRKRWLRLSIRCPQCGKGPGLRIDPQFARLVVYVVKALGGIGHALSYKCPRCHKQYPISLEALASDAEAE